MSVSSVSRAFERFECFAAMKNPPAHRPYSPPHHAHHPTHPPTHHARHTHHAPPPAPRALPFSYVQIDGHTVLKANNYGLEEGESSVWGSETKQAKPMPKKPLSAYALFCAHFRAEKKAVQGEAEGEGEGEGEG